MYPQLLYYDLGENVTAFSSERGGGVSTGNYAQFNVNMFCGDNISNIKENRKALCELLNIGYGNIFMPHQIHSNKCVRITKEAASLDSLKRSNLLEGVDALITNEKNICIGVSTADCIPLVVYDIKHHAAGVIHAGWRGTCNRIVEHVVNTMSETFGSQPADIKAAIGPGISMECFEVGDEVYSHFKDAGFDMNVIARKYPATRKEDLDAEISEKWHIDLFEANRLQLTKSGIPEENIQSAGFCTYKNSDRFFSARKLGTNSGRILTGIILR